ncbi:MAG: thiosulfate sulfurtransferase GlpE [Pseudohongiellaceae bacterium]
MNFRRIDVAEARRLLADNAQIIDIRDDQSYAAGHIEAARHVDSGNMQEFVQEADLDRPLIIYCYHGNMSQGAAAWMAEQGFEHTFSLDGGYEAWVDKSSAAPAASK